MNFETSLLCAILDCGSADVGLMKDCAYDCTELLEYLKDDLGLVKIDINNLVYAMFEFGKRDIRNSIDERIEELKEMDELTEEESQELEELQQLDVYEDITSFHNYIDTHVYLSDKEEIYTKYLQHALSEFEDKTGFNISY